VSFLVSSVEKGIVHSFSIFKKDYSQKFVDFLDFPPHAKTTILLHLNLLRIFNNLSNPFKFYTTPIGSGSHIIKILRKFHFSLVA